MRVLSGGTQEGHEIPADRRDEGQVNQKRIDAPEAGKRLDGGRTKPEGRNRDTQGGVAGCNEQRSGMDVGNGVADKEARQFSPFKCYFWAARRAALSMSPPS